MSWASPKRQRQYPVWLEAHCRIQTHLSQLKETAILIECQSPWNTPLLPVNKTDGGYRPIQDLQAINRVTVSLHPVIPNPYTLLGQIPNLSRWFTCLDLKDTFFCLHLAPLSQPLFAFKWADLETGYQIQLTWTPFPQGFKNSPTLFREALAADLAGFPQETTR
jgi:hypothetical protein